MDAPIARTSLGDLRGASQDGIAAFRGVPFASPPVGERRFTAAQSGKVGADCVMRPGMVRSRRNCRHVCAWRWAISAPPG